MRKLILIAGLLSLSAQAQTYVTPSGTYMTSQVGSTTYVTPVARSSGSTSHSGVAMTAPASGSNTYVTPSGTYMTSRVGSTTYVIQTSKSGGRK